MTVLKTGLIGCGKFANKHVANLVSMPDKFNMVAFCDIQRENADEFNNNYAKGNAKVYTKFEELFDKTQLDLVLICLPPFAHTNEVEIAAEHGKSS
jgi:predicted dehydrogenase